MSSPTFQRVLVLGYGTAGSCILKALGRRSNQFHTSLLVRPASVATNAARLEPFRVLGIELVEGDLKAEEADLTSLLKGYDTVISCVTHERMGTDEMRVARAAKAAGVTRYLPTAFGVDEAAVSPNSPMSFIFDKKVAKFAAIAQLGLPYTIVNNGLWTEWLLDEGPRSLLGLDWQQRVMTVVGSFDSKISTTTLRDVGELVAEVLLDPSTVNQHVHVQSELVTLEQICATVERATGQAWQRKVLSLAEVPKPAHPGDFSFTFRVIIADQRGVWWRTEDSWNAKRNLSFRLTGVHEVADTIAKQKRTAHTG